MKIGRKVITTEKVGKLNIIKVLGRVAQKNSKSILETRRKFVLNGAEMNVIIRWIKYLIKSEPMIGKRGWEITTKLPY